MAKSQGNRGGSRSKNNNPQGRNQYSSGWMGIARERPAATAAAAAGAVAAGVFLWSKRAQISDQLSHLSEQIGEWTDTMNSDNGEPELAMVGADSNVTGTTPRRSRSTTGSGRRSATAGSTISAGNGGSPIA